MIALYLVHGGCFAPINSLTSRPISNIYIYIYFTREKKTFHFCITFSFLEEKKALVRVEIQISPFSRWNIEGKRKRKKYKITSINIPLLCRGIQKHRRVHPMPSRPSFGMIGTRIFHTDVFNINSIRQGLRHRMAVAFSRATLVYTLAF